MKIFFNINYKVKVCFIFKNIVNIYKFLIIFIDCIYLINLFYEEIKHIQYK